MSRTDKFSLGAIVAVITSLGVLTLGNAFGANPVALLCFAPFGQLVVGYLLGRRDESKTQPGKVK